MRLLYTPQSKTSSTLLTEVFRLLYEIDHLHPQKKRSRQYITHGPIPRHAGLGVRFGCWFWVHEFDTGFGPINTPSTPPTYVMTGALHSGRHHLDEPVQCRILS